MTDRHPLIHVGYHKTGTTWLQQRIFTDPGRFTQVRPRTIIDEAFVVCHPFRFDPGDAAAHLEPFFKEAKETDTVCVLSHERLVGQPGQAGVDARPIADRLVATYPDAKILIVIREQRGMMFSTYGQYLKRFGKATFEDLWGERTIRERRRFATTAEVFEYHDLISYYQRALGKDQVLVLPYEYLRIDAAGFANEVCTFAGVQPFEAVPTDPENIAIPAGALAGVRYLNIAFGVVGLGTVFSGPVADKWIRKARLRFLQRIGPRVPARISRRVEQRWRDAALRIAGDRFADSNRITQELTGLDLGSYGYMV